MSREESREEQQAPLLLDSSDWKYVGEGGKHAVFAYLHQPEEKAAVTQAQATQLRRREWAGRLLRIDKNVLARSAAAAADAAGAATSDAEIATAAAAVAAALPSEEARVHTTVDNFREMVHSILHPYIDLPEVITLSWHFVAALRRTALCDNRIPDRRRNDWSTQKESDEEESVVYEHAPIGFLMNDYRLSLAAAGQRSFCVEIKPKAGYTAFSPLVAQNRTGKYLHSRFTLLQQLYFDGRRTTDWMDASDTFEPSSYDPLDLFSGDAARVRRALYSLRAYPQNNLKIWAENELLLGVGTLKQQQQHGGPLFDSGEIWGVGSTLGGDAVGDNHVTSLLVEMTASVLLEEAFLPDLVALQRLDILDGDGAIAVYRRLVFLCDGDQDKAEHLLDSFPEWTGNKVAGTLPYPLLHSSPLAPPDHVPNLGLLCTEIDALARLLESSRPGLPTPTQLNDSRMRALEILHLLSVDECRYLLQNWLLSLTMSDLSFFVTFRAAGATEGAEELRMPSSDPFRCRVLSRQQHGSPGRIAFRSSPSLDHCDSLMFFELKAIDFDRKPARKLRSRHVKEAYFNTTQIF